MVSGTICHSCSMDAAGTAAGTTETFPPEEAMARARFSRFDVDQDGLLSQGEVGQMMEQLGFEVDDDYVHAIFSKFNVVGEGIDFYEFSTLWEFCQMHAS